jgi:hypothetical protein
VNAVFLEADSDPATSRVHAARRNLLATTGAFPEFRLFGRDVYYSDLQAAHRQAGTLNLISAMGHGASGEFTGQWEKVVYDLTDSASTIGTCRNAIVHLFSCDCAQILGAYLVTAGAKAFIGYTSPVNVPIAQSVVDEFVRVAADIDRSILNGDSSATTKRKADIEFTNVEVRLRATSSKATPRDLANFRLNNQSMVGPWSDRKYGTY